MKTGNMKYGKWNTGVNGHMTVSLRRKHNQTEVLSW